MTLNVLCNLNHSIILQQGIPMVFHSGKVEKMTTVCHSQPFATWKYEKKKR